MTREKCCAWLGAGRDHPKEVTCQVRLNAGEEGLWPNEEQLGLC